MKKKTVIDKKPNQMNELKFYSCVASCLQIISEEKKKTNERTIGEICWIQASDAHPYRPMQRFTVRLPYRIEGEKKTSSSE